MGVEYVLAVVHIKHRVTAFGMIVVTRREPYKHVAGGKAVGLKSVEILYVPSNLPKHFVLDVFPVFYGKADCCIVGETLMVIARDDAIFADGLFVPVSFGKLKVDKFIGGEEHFASPQGAVGIGL